MAGYADMVALVGLEVDRELRVIVGLAPSRWECWSRVAASQVARH